MSNFSFLDEPTTAGCPYCGQPMQLTAELAGQTVACPNCHAQIVIPANEPPRQAAPVRRPAGKDKHVVAATLGGALVSAGVCAGAVLVSAIPDGYVYAFDQVITVAIGLGFLAGVTGGFISGCVAYLKS